MLSPSVYFPHRVKPQSGLNRLCADGLQCTTNSTYPERRELDFQRIVLPSGCVLFRPIESQAQSREPK